MEINRHITQLAQRLRDRHRISMPRSAVRPKPKGRGRRPDTGLPGDVALAEPLPGSRHEMDTDWHGGDRPGRRPYVSDYRNGVSRAGIPATHRRKREPERSRRSGTAHPQAELETL